MRGGDKGRVTTAALQHKKRHDKYALRVSQCWRDEKRCCQHYRRRTSLVHETARLMENSGHFLVLNKTTGPYSGSCHLNAPSWCPSPS